MVWVGRPALIHAQPITHTGADIIISQNDSELRLGIGYGVDIPVRSPGQMVPEKHSFG